MTIDKTPMVRLVGLEKRYGHVLALGKTDLDIREGEFLTLLGPSGSGKTTLLNMIAGMVDPTEGTIRIAGKDMTNVPSEKRGLGMVFQNYALMPHMTVFDNIAFPLKIRKVPRAEIKARVMEVLKLVKLDHLADRKPKALSGGQQQRISLARCIVYNPSIILMDEPLGALDKKLREQMQIEIKRLHTQLKTTMLYVTHDQEEALTMSDRIILMNNAKIEQIGTPHELYFYPATRFAADFLGISNLLDIEMLSADRARLATGQQIAVQTDDAVRAGTKAHLMIRPENMRLAATASGSNSAEGTLVSSMNVGSTIKHFVQLPGMEEPLVSQELTSIEAASRQSGDRVFLSWEPANSRILWN